MHDKDILIDNWLEKAEEALKGVKDNIEINHLSIAQNRIYYAVFYSVMALACNEDFITSKHTELRGWFNKNFIKTGKLDTEIGNIYKKAYEERTKSDYTITFKPKKDNILKAYEETRTFIDTIKAYIKTDKWA